MVRGMATRGKIAAWVYILCSLILLMQATGSLTTTGVLAAQERRLTYGSTVEGILTPNDPAHAWQFVGSAGDVVSIQMNAVLDPDFVDPETGIDTDLDTLLVLEFEDGTLLAEDDDGGEETNSRIENFELPADGIYTVVATSFSGDETGRYELHVDLVGRRVRRIEFVGVAGYGERITAELTPEVVGHVWELEARAGDEVFISMDALSEDLDPFLLLLQMGDAQLERFFALGDAQLTDLVSAADELGALRALNDDREGERNALIPSFVLPGDGRYFIVATSCCTGESSGPYALAVDLGTAQPSEPPLVDPEVGEPDVDEPDVGEPQVDEADSGEPDQEAFDEPPGDAESPPFALLPIVVGGGLFLGLLFLVGMVAPAAWRRFRPPAPVDVAAEALPGELPPPAAPVVRFKHQWDPGRVSIVPGGKSLRFDLDIRFRLSHGPSEQQIDMDQSSSLT